MGSPDGSDKRYLDSDRRLTLALGSPLLLAIGLTIALFVVTGTGVPGLADQSPQAAPASNDSEQPSRSGGGSGIETPEQPAPTDDVSSDRQGNVPVPPEQQLATGSIVGTVSDGSPVPNATITIRNVSHPNVTVSDIATVRVQTNASGGYAFEAVPVGTVTVRVNGSEFDPVQRNATITAGQETRLDITVSSTDEDDAGGEAADPPTLPPDPPPPDEDDDTDQSRNDRDGDGIPDRDDTAPETPEDFDGVEDGDGAPESDADGDGIPDGDDAAPETPEDEDGFEDGDGAPDPNQAPSGLTILGVGDGGTGGIEAGSEIRVVFTEAIDPDGDVELYRVHFGDGTSIALSDPQRSDGGNLQVTHTYTAAGTYDVTVTAVDDDGATTNDTASVTIDGDNEPPTGLDFGDLLIRDVAGDELTISVDEASDPDGTIVEYRWEFDDGTTITTAEPTASHTYTDPGTYELTITAVDDDGATTAGCITIEIEAG